MIEAEFPKITRGEFKTLQVNLGYKCNQACSHCHVDASPKRTEMMDKETVDLIPIVLEKYELNNLDLTGGAPEMHPCFRDLVIKCRSLGVKVMDRCNLTILKERNYETLSKFLADNRVEIVASLPCYLESNVDKQRGSGVFEKSIAALQELNRLGYANKDGSLILNLVYNPQGAVLPPNQTGLEKLYRLELKERFGIIFNNLYVITNMPIKRFADQLKVQNKFEDYHKLLVQNFNSQNLNHLMCKDTISIDWQGVLFDCDFNQQLGLKYKNKIVSLSDLVSDKFNFKEEPIHVGQHCYGCTAGSGSSCGGSLIQD